MSLPQELFDMIIDESFGLPNESERTGALTSLSLVSRTFRERAHNHLFASITFGRGEDPTTAAERFLSLLKDDPNTETTGVASRITWFQCWIPRRNADPLTGILKKLFIGEGKLCSLSLLFTHSPRIRWSSLSEHLAEGVFQVCHRPRLASLSLYNLWDIPRNFLRNTFITRLFLHNVSVLNNQLPESLFAGISGQGQSETVNLQMLHIACIFNKPVLPLLTTSKEIDPTVNLSELREFRFISHSSKFSSKTILEKILMGSKAHLEILKISFEQAPNRELVLALQGHNNLHTFGLTSLSPSATSLSDMATLLGQAEYLPSLQVIKLRFPILPSVLLPDDDGTFLALDSLGSQALDYLFAQKKFCNIRTLTLEVYNYYAFPPDSHLRTLEEYEALIRSRFPHIATLENLTFSVHVTIH
ncbi:hypothetical protein CPC08DRAFT_769963 [Agrocybe pediades]|nr:hypothetical protein CPC08DRAFT_769963 [Agrocybe pediades]